ncbi:MAG: hypothetical protein M3O91_10485 [Chloroflexota bacterium]|nr:hypothetical protein [Chloroflexota bacterium]
MSYIEEDSPANARAVVDRLDRRMQRLRRFPRSAAPDTRAPSELPSGIEARMASESGFNVRYVFPVRIGSDAEMILVISIRRGTRMLIDDAEVLVRYVEELTRAERE